MDTSFNSRAFLAAFTLLLIVIAVPVAVAQPQPKPDGATFVAAAEIVGTIVDGNGKPLPGALVTVAGTGREAATDTDGAFRFNGLRPGRYTIQVDLSGFARAERVVELKAGEQLTLPVTLDEGAYLFEQVVVSEDGYAARRSLTSTRTSAELRDLPQSIQVINKDLAQDQGATYLSDALRNASGVTQFSEYLDFNIRGFRSQADGAVKVDGLNQVHDFFMKPRMLNVERVEVVKGPAGALYGQSKPGGFVNVITKQPAARRASDVAVHLGSFDKSELRGSSTGPLPAGNLFYLVDAARIDNRGFRLHEQYVYTGLAGSVTWAPTARTSITGGGEVFDDLARGHRNRGVPFFQNRIVDVPVDFTVNEPDDRVQIEAATSRARLLHQAADDWRLDASVSYLSNSSVQQYHEPMGLRPDGRMMRREFRDQYREKEQAAANANVAWTPAAFGGARHSVLVGGEYTLTNGLLRSGTALDSSRGGPVPDLDIYAPVFGSESAPLRFGYYGPDVPGGITSLATSTNNRVRASGVYLQDQAAIGTRVNVLAGIRFDEFRDDARGGAARSRTGHAISLRAGGVVDVAGRWSVYGNYAEGFEPPSATFSLEPERYGGPFDPESSWSVESGVKGFLFGDRVTTTVALYHITKRGMLLRSPTPELPDRYAPVGAFESRGVEVDVAGRVTSRFSLYANYAHSFLAEVTEDVNPANLGKPAENNPADAANVWARYDVATGRGWRLGFGGGVTHVSSRLTFEVGDVLPSYTKSDAAVFFDVGRIGAALNLFNLTNERYFTGGYGGRNGGFLGAPRSAELRLTYRF